MPVLPYPIQGSLFPVTGKDSSGNLLMHGKVAYLVLALWIIHFVRRTVEVLFVHIYKRKMPLSEAIGAPLYYWFFALFIAWSVKHKFHLPPVGLAIFGMLVFILGEIGNAYCHLQLRRFRTRQYESILISPTTGHVLPHGFLFNRVSSPHYFCEIVSWVGYFLVVLTLPALLLLLCTIVTLVIYSGKKHRAYIDEFDGLDGRPLYPEERKALVPFCF